MPAGILIYDGDCSFCTSTANWAKQRLSGNYEVLPWQGFNLDSVGLSEADVNRSAWWVDSDGSLHQEHHCVAKALCAMGKPWPLLGCLLTLGPFNPLARAIYRLVAANRSRISRLITKYQRGPKRH